MGGPSKRADIRLIFPADEGFKSIIRVLYSVPRPPTAMGDRDVRESGARTPSIMTWDHAVRISASATQNFPSRRLSLRKRAPPNTTQPTTRCSTSTRMLFRAPSPSVPSFPASLMCGWKKAMQPSLDVEPKRNNHSTRYSGYVTTHLISSFDAIENGEPFCSQRSHGCPEPLVGPKQH